MKATIITAALALSASMAVSAEHQPAEQQPADTTRATTTTTTTTTVIATLHSQQDSPLVAAAKRSGRLGKKPSQVITNDTLVKSGGHFTTTKSQDALPNQQQPGSAPVPAGATDKPLTTKNMPGPATTAPAQPKKTDAVKHAAADTQEGVMHQSTAGQPIDGPKPVTPPASAPKPPQ